MVGAVADQALYRKYRSGNFTEVIGQDHVVKTLTTAIASGRLSHAYLFTGPRGTGKTSVARLLARALNCTGDSKPCNQCPNCLAAINSSLDVIEIDAASNRSIDAVRDLRDKVGLAPSQGQYKIYIIDEVHMLTTEAFNALLKTLEEPPAHAVFILATTEAHKLPETIISRTQRFTFRPHTEANITAHLSTIATAENIPAEPAALQMVAIAARGGFRDAISMLDQLAASGANPITPDTVRSLLGYSDATEIAALSQAIAARDTRAALEVLARLETSGSQAGQVAVQLADFWRAVLLASAGASQTDDAAVTAVAKSTTPNQAATIVEALIEIGRSHWPQLALEATVVKLTVGATSSVPEPTVASTGPSRRAASSHTKTSSPAEAITTTETSSPTGTLKAELWPKVLVLLKTENNSLCALLQMYPVDFNNEEITIKPRFNFHRDLFMKPANRSIIETAASKVYGRPVKFSARTEETAPKSKRAQSDPSSELVSSALEILGGEIVE